MNKLHSYIINEAVNKLSNKIADSLDQDQITQLCLAHPRLMDAIGIAIVAKMDDGVIFNETVLANALTHNAEFMQRIAMLITPQIVESIDTTVIAEDIVEDENWVASHLVPQLLASTSFCSNVSKFMEKSNVLQSGVAQEIPLSSLAYHVDIDYDELHNHLDYSEVAYSVDAESIAAYVCTEEVSNDLDLEEIEEGVFKRIVAQITGSDQGEDPIKTLVLMDSVVHRASDVLIMSIEQQLTEPQEE